MHCAKILLVIFLLALVCLAASRKVSKDYLYPVHNLKPSASPAVQEQTVQGLIQRLFPERHADFVIHVDPDIVADHSEAFIIGNEGPKISVTATTGVTAATGLYYYLKNYCGVHVSWSGIQNNLPNVLPILANPLKVVLNDKFRYYQNVCTVSYSMVWWDWSRWEQEIDWMALSGINLPLAFNAQEEIWKRTFFKFSLTQEDVDAFFSGPTFFAWQRMGNFRGWGGPLSDNWHKKQVALQHQILDRMRNFGMIPVLPAFSGHVPRAFEKLHNDTLFTRLKWEQFPDQYCCTTFVYPNQTLFAEIGQTFLKEYISEFGTDHVYNTDLFNEMASPSGDLTFLDSCGKSVFGAMTAEDPDAVWIMQGWLFINAPTFWTQERTKAFLKSVPQGRLVVLDLQSELYPVYDKFESYYGQPFIWNMLLNFGGNLGLYGSIDPVNNGPFTARNYPGSTMIGTGLTPEGIEQNDVMFEFMNENAYRKAPVDTDFWMQDYSRRRYGKQNLDAVRAWIKLKGSVYNVTLYGPKDHGKYTIVSRPSLSLTKTIWYNPDDVYDAWTSFLTASCDSNISSLETFRYDLVDVGRQSLQLLGDKVYTEIVQNFKNKDIDQFRFAAKLFEEILQDLDRLVSTDEHFLLGKWLQSARSWGETEEEKNLFEFNSRNQLTLWGADGQILDYANKQWGGLFRGYYLPRWQAFFQTLDRQLQSGNGFSQDLFNKEVLYFVEQPFTLHREAYSATPSGDPIAISNELYMKYKPLMLKQDVYVEEFHLKDNNEILIQDGSLYIPHFVPLSLKTFWQK